MIFFMHKTSQNVVLLNERNQDFLCITNQTPGIIKKCVFYAKAKYITTSLRTQRRSSEYVTPPFNRARS